MKLLFFLSIMILSISFEGYGQDTSQLKRTPYNLKVAVDSKTFYEEEIKATPYVLPDETIQIYPGETIYAEVAQENGIIKHLTAVSEVKNPAKTITIAFTQTEKNHTHELMMLKISNPFPKKLIYTAHIYLLQQHKWANTDVYPIEAGLSGFETWPDVITSIALGKWVFENK